MSGQPYRYASDPERYRAMYMENLNNTAQMDNLVLQAVKEYTQTGMIPPAAQLIDNRTTSEKLADIEKLKIGIIKDLESIMDQNTALTLIKGLSQSPLNSDNKLIVFFAQAGKALVDRLKEQYKYGIKGDANDIETFVDFVNNAYSKKLKGVQSVKELTQSTNSGRDLLNTTVLQQYKNTLEEIFPQIVNLNLRSGGRQSADIDNKLTGIRQILNGLIQELPTDQEQNQMKQMISDDSPNTQIYTLVFDIMRTELPKKEVLEGLLVQANSAVKGQNLNLALQLIDQFYSLISPLYQQLGVFTQAKNDLQDELNPVQQQQPGILGNAYNVIGNFLNRGGVPAMGGVGIKRRPGRPKGSGMPLHLKIDPNNKIEPMPQYTQFGKFLINNHRLSEDIMSLRSGKGHVIKDMPSFKLSPQFKKVVKKITGGSIPTEDDINCLTDEEIKYLNKLSKRANVYDKLNIPTPSKSKEEQDMHDFEVMKGEIMSGNDNSDMIRKFKILLMKFHKQGRIPKNEYHEIMEDLMTLGI